MIPSISKAEIEEPRPPDELFRWVRDVYELFGKTKQGRSAFRLRKNASLKEFQEEVWPLASYAHLFHAGRDVLFQPVLGNQSYDALILEAESRNLLNHVEITTALDGSAGYQEWLRTLHLEQHGRAPVTGVHFSIDRASGAVPESYSEMVEHGEARDAEISRIKRAVERKAQKRYPPDTVLVVEFRSLHFSKPQDREVLERSGRCLFQRISSIFGELALVDVPGAIGFRYPTS